MARLAVIIREPKNILDTLVPFTLYFQSDVEKKSRKMQPNILNSTIIFFRMFWKGYEQKNVIYRLVPFMLHFQSDVVKKRPLRLGIRNGVVFV